MLLGAKQREANIFEAVSFSPPWWMTISKDVGGNTGGKPNLAPANFPAFAEYLSDVVQQYERVWNVSFSTLAPMNEPLEWWWGDQSIQEGCAFSAKSIFPMLRAMREAMDRKGLQAVKLSGVDDWASPTVAFLLRAAATGEASEMALIEKLEVHGYQSPTPLNPKLSQVASFRLLRKVGLRKVWHITLRPMQECTILRCTWCNFKAGKRSPSSPCRDRPCIIHAQWTPIQKLITHRY